MMCTEIFWQLVSLAFPLYFPATILSFLNRIKMKYIDFESWTVTWLHEANVIVEDRLTHNFKRRSRTAPPKAVFYA